MKKITILLTLLTILGLLVACGRNADTTSNSNQQESALESDTSQDSTAPEKNFEVPLQTTLIVGTFELEGTENEVTADQVAELLPLWMVLKNLLESDTAAMDEITALTKQIGNTMTEAQIAFISDLEIDPQSQRALMDELGLTEGFERPETTEGEEGTSRGGNRPEGMPSGMGPGGQGGEGLSPEQMEAMQATREAGGGGMRGGMGMMGNIVLIDALIELLQSK